MAVRVTFDPDSRIPEPLREMFISWHRSKPASQFRQYGALDKYLNLKFPLDLVKPQNEIRSLVSDIHLFEDATTHAEAQTIADEWEMGNISISSFGDVVSSTASKKYPDFVVASYFGSNEEGDLLPEVPRLVIEVGSLGRQLKPPTKDEKSNIIAQLLGYLDQFGYTGEQWKSAPQGIALIGTEAAFLYPRGVTKENAIRWSCKGGMRNDEGTWYSIFDEDSQPSAWTDVIDKISEVSTKEAEEFGRHGKAPVRVDVARK